MRRFRVVFQIPSSYFSVERPYSDKIGQFHCIFADMAEPIVVELHDLRSEMFGAAIHVGIVADVKVSADTIQQATALAAQRLEAVLQLAALQSNAAVANPKLWLAVEITPESESTEMVQVEDRFDEVFSKKRGLDHASMERLGQAFDQHGSDRIARALHWYRKGLSEAYPIDQFTSFWVGLEAINKPLIDLLREDEETGACKSCGATYVIPTNKGIRALFRDYSANDVKDFKMCRDLRVDIQHSSSSLDDAFAKAPQAADLTRRMLRAAIYILLGLPAAEGLTAPSTIYDNQGLHTEYQVRFLASSEVVGAGPLLDTSETAITVTQDGERRHVAIEPKVKWDVNAPAELRMIYVTQAGAWSEVPAKQTVKEDHAPSNENVNRLVEGHSDSPMSTD